MVPDQDSRLRWVRFPGGVGLAGWDGPLKPQRLRPGGHGRRKKFPVIHGGPCLRVEAKLDEMGRNGV